MTESQKETILSNLIEQLELPDHAYEKAKRRYEDLGKWFDREDSLLENNDPHIFPQGSFRLGTAIRPINERDEYDLDLACKLRSGFDKRNVTQEELKKIVGSELELYRTARGIQKKLEPKHRCWRLEYQDEISFHMDIVPCIPAESIKREAILKSIRSTGLEDSLAVSAAHTTIAITDDRHISFNKITEDWNISNPEGYAKWFGYRMQSLPSEYRMEKAQVDDVPQYKIKSPLQRVVQLLKRHRDCWSIQNPESKPISIIITTLAARAYQGETNLQLALNNVIGKMESYINASIPRVPNPVDPGEDFADRWYRPDSLHLRLEETFHLWLMQVKKDFQHITSTTDTEFIREMAENKFSVKINSDILKKGLGVEQKPVHIIPIKHHLEESNPPKPWRI
ncbi:MULTISPECIES: nucleotidyltransferase [unclassified Oceanispirochaeta]|uniref:nucleotidyltransferase domain-containing protein n=1 Tax=unclassified Oceanispirochaeta TaxID=2635722 RepID=UPI000E09A438|nr:MULTISPECIES: nucleotidyltransferase [unclassified Oceanispirochaeta]MBF9016726.1 nucleotidyltransferase [Oceanispirochaeta sp. M2]NPD71996.1 nucleotidyltransferase [Oceanispirochaeta sp. M1]RDG32441.1 nucleotidyltransferase [Oceanispirochaeta sp. M1]